MQTINRLFGALALATAVAVPLASASAQTTIRFATSVPEAETAEVLGMKAMKEYIEFKSDGELSVDLLFGTLGAIVLGVFAAQLLNREFRGRSILRGLYLFPYVAPVIAMAFTWLVLFDPFSGAINTMLQRMDVTGSPINFFGERMVPVNVFGLEFGFPLALAMVIAFEAWRYFPLSFLFILARMQSIPTDMYEAADMDGATPFQKFFRLSMPQIMGIIAVLFLLRFIWTFNKFDDIFLLTGGAAGTRTLTVDVYYQGFAIGNLGAGAAVAVVIFVMLLIFALLYFRAMPKGEGL